MKKNVKFSVLTALGMFLLAGTLFVLSGCGGSSSTPTTTATTGSTATVTGKVQSSAKYKDFTGYKIYAQAKSTHKLYYVAVNADGSFSLPVGNNASYILTLVNDKSRMEAVFIMIDGPASLTTGLKVTQNADLGTFTLDTGKGKLVSSSDLSVDADFVLTARASSGRPIGYGNLGKGAEAKLPAKLGKPDTSSPDQDSDGLIDSYDADADGNGTVDEVQAAESDGTSLATTKSGKSSACIKSVGVFMNLKIGYDRTNSIDTKEDMVLTLELVPTNSTCAADISKVEVLNGPTYLKTATVVPSANGWTDNIIPSAYPAAGTLWSAVSSGSYDMFNLTPPSETVGRWTIWITAHDTVTAGDSFHFKVTYKSSSEEHFVKMVDYVFTNIPIMTKYQGSSDAAESTAPAPAANGSGTSASPIAFSGDNLTLKWDRPKDESSSTIYGMKYIFRIFYWAGGTQKEEKLCSTSVSDDATGTVTMQATLTKTDCLASTTSGGTTVDYYQIDITASSTAGDNSAQIPHFKRQ